MIDPGNRKSHPPFFKIREGEGLSDTKAIYGKIKVNQKRIKSIFVSLLISPENNLEYGLDL